MLDPRVGTLLEQAERGKQKNLFGQSRTHASRWTCRFEALSDGASMGVPGKTVIVP